MSTITPDEGVHIYLKPNDNAETGLLKNATVHERYIILMNETLQVSAKKDLCTIKELESRVTELEDEAEQFDSRRNYMKGLLKNFHEMHKMNDELVLLQSQMKEGSKASVKRYKSRLAWHLCALHCMLVLVLGLSYEVSIPCDTAFLWLVVLIVISFNYSMLKNLKVSVFTDVEDKVTRLTTEKNKVHDAQDYIYEFIESQ